ncbi:hypothetical protein [Amycolatopsis sp. cmx-11-12]|uniref:hypothetical protein n=1 Tax=Amycolatopsis sp. cmx-11-12 TaxID=2785795 RepID=UPI00391857DC
MKGRTMTISQSHEEALVEPVWAIDLASVPWTAYEDEHLPTGEQAALLKIVKPNRWSTGPISADWAS